MAKKSSSQLKRRNIILAIIAVIVIGAVCGAALFLQPAADSPQTKAPADGAIKISGTVMCLPHKDTSGPQTLECAYGLKDDSGRYYGLKDSDPTYKNISGVPVNTHVTVSGTFSKKSDTKYPTVGIIEVTSIAE